MADSNFRGPVNSMGALEVDAATAQVYPLDGPSMAYQGYAMPDIRSAPFAKDGFRPGQQPALVIGNAALVCDNIPQAINSTRIATTAVIATTSFSLALQTVGVAGVASVASLAVGVPIIPAGTTVATTAALAIDFGFATGTTVAGSTTVVVVDNTVFHVGQWLVLGNVGNTAATRSLVAQCMSVLSNGTGITLSQAAGTGLASVPIGQGNLFGSGLLPPATQFGPAAASASGHSFAGQMAAGLARVLNPRETITRNISITCVTSTNFSATVFGWDLWGNPMTEVLTLTAQTTAAGKKTFKYIDRIVSGTTTVVGVSFGLGDTFGYPFRVDEWDLTDVTWNNSAAVSSNGFTAAALTNPSTNVSGDVRGTVQLSTAILTGVIATSVSAVATNGTSRVTLRQTFGVWNQIAGTPVNTVPMFGLAQSTT